MEKDFRNGMSIQQKTEMLRNALQKLSMLPPQKNPRGIHMNRQHYPKCWNCQIQLPENAQICHNCGKCQRCKT